MTLHVLMWMPRSSDVPGGHQTQATSTAAALRELDVQVRETTEANPDLLGIDIVHGFGLDAAEIHYSRMHGVPVALSTIYRLRAYRYSYAGGPTGIAAVGDRIRSIGGAIRRASLERPSHYTQLSRLLSDDFNLTAAYSSADVLLPNAEGEAYDIARDLCVPTRCVIVPNAVDPTLFPAPQDQWASRPVDVLMVGRIEPHKNQLGLIEAMRDQGYRITIVGPDHPDHRAYANECRRTGAGWVDFISETSLDRLASIYSSAKVHVLPSWLESTGLVSLEAALCGCAVVSTSRGYAREYLDSYAKYCDPRDPSSIRDAIKAALSSGPSQLLRGRVLARYTWRHTALATLDAYRQVLQAS